MKIENDRNQIWTIALSGAAVAPFLHSAWAR
jgi:hypothetical protein